MLLHSEHFHCTLPTLAKQLMYAKQLLHLAMRAAGGNASSSSADPSPGKKGLTTQP
jgi:hypothetical protein